ncbi:capsid maturation protease [Mycobacterium phage Panamaxus]|uniref:Capsid maturation protease fusion protein n=1 Tax=Mycobacterium phage Veracruz TaxID=2530154 RepID=A0A481VTC9_9CAUD|nr:capsid maturation protease fusion protein [Mycobacterium phage Veracruz]AIS73687.1 capsid maturation protease [Mycobacterium phage QuinnKiro]ALA11816.1 capsid maturation protease [Mycobacterium phage Texage]AOT24163.1 capsid maturation protease [Mycobacterium phage Todacoro]AUX82310.1 capsid maturation protease [Mycobacterium phage Lambert1]AVP42939.1 capsid maturation protease [Mycobacterium phage Panamaxus]AWY03545.1 capsid maturation protease [Mycobacterium phage Hookmount]AYR03393.1 c
MNADEYAAQQAVISAAVARYVLQLGKFFRAPTLSVTDWITFLEMLYPEVYQRRLEAAELARLFYDSEREKHGRPRQARYLVEYDFAEFVDDMEPTRRRMSQGDAPESALGDVALRIVRSVEMAGRKQIIRAVEDDPQSGVVKGWARVATGRETCAWCLMLISRGPVYLGADTAGLDLDDTTAAEMWAAGEDVSEYMRQWHDGCDCKVVPVYDRKNWPGYDAWKRAEKLWIEAGREASRLIESGEARTNNMNKETQNALRRRLERGDIHISEFAALAA